MEQLSVGSGYDVVQELNRKMIHKWIDIKVGSIYYTLKQLHSDGLIREVEEVQQGNYPTKMLYEVTAAGQELFDELQEEAFMGLFPHFYGFKLALKFNVRRTPDEIESYAIRAIDRIDRHLREMDKYLATLEPDSPHYQYDAFFIDHDRRLFEAERAWIREATEFIHQWNGPDE